MTTKYVVGTIEEIPPGKQKKVHLKGRDIALFNLDGAFYALGDKCPHEGGSLCSGKVVGLAYSSEPGKYDLLRPGEFVKCPWHGWEFDIRTGQSYCDPQKTRVRMYESHVENGDELAKGPYVAETFKVSVDQQYVVIEL